MRKEQLKVLAIYGDPVPATVFTDNADTEWCRFLVSGSWSGPQDTSKAGRTMQVETLPDGSFTVTVQKLIPARRAEDDSWLNEQTDLALNAIEETLGLDSSSLSSCENRIGHDDTRFDCLMETSEQDFVDTVEALMELNTFCDICGYFYNADLESAGDSHPSVNNGYNCRHPHCEDAEFGIGCCRASCCPLSYPADGLVCQRCGSNCSECGEEGCECEDDYVVATIPRRLFSARTMLLVPQEEEK